MDEHREISIAEFFEKNRHLLGFSNFQKAIVTCVKEAVDNSLDAAEEEDILPEVHVIIEDLGKDRLRLTFKDNASGIAKKHIPKVFGKLLYGSKFHKLMQSRGQQGIGISAAALYAQLTTGNPIQIISKLKGSTKVHAFTLHLDTRKNEPEIIKEELLDTYEFPHGTSIQMDIEAKYTRGTHSVFQYLKSVAIVNPSAKLILQEPDGKIYEFPRVTKDLPKKAKEIKPHPYGVELGILMRMLKETKARTIGSFLMSEFTRVGKTTAQQICKAAEIDVVNGIRFVTGWERRPNTLSKDDIERILRAMQTTNIQNPPTDCLAPIGEELLNKGLIKELNPEFSAVVTRNPSVYRGMPFQIETAIAYGGGITEGRLMRFANKVPLLYQQSAGVTMKALKSTDWPRYGLKQSGDLPQGPVLVLMHMCSVWVPFTSEGKQAIADYPEILKEMKLALQEVGRKLRTYISKKRKGQIEEKKFKTLTAYAKEMVEPLAYLVETTTKEDISMYFEALLKSKYTMIGGVAIDNETLKELQKEVSQQEEENASTE